ncbi:hypothetical protein FEM48_Zijuj01G0042300 [Ziziphus jujuba var. spinosa]|uniref:HMA domain-containing protein n=1 Tax=Ziziphus jujuba var. spinosa TaxID=714518 RepID=A0A978VZ33_ZIZJJ|nr:hypothetical protein FEM48_Zijuj01G0042300 [Ziziphus jujuba var. spinosa]
MTVVEMAVHMDCPGCETKIKKALRKLKGVDDVDVDINMQKVTVMGWAEQEKVLRTVRKTGRKAELWPYPYTPEYHHNTTLRYYYHQQHHNHKQPLINFHNINTSRLESPFVSYGNYYEYGYYNNINNDGRNYGPYDNSTAFDEKARAMFSDENPHACSIM